MRAGLGPDVRFVTDAERNAQVDAILARAPRPGRVWVFAFGSLIWNPAFHFVERRTARIHGFHRQFCLWARAGRGSPEQPGLMLSLVSGGSCTGVAYRLRRRAAATELDVLWRREMATMAYRPVWTTAHTPEGREPAIAFSANPSMNATCRGSRKKRWRATSRPARAPMGRCCDYLFDTVAHLRQLGIRDRRLEALEKRVRAQQ